jgi:hypothetical protein
MKSILLRFGLAALAVASLAQAQGRMIDSDDYQCNHGDTSSERTQEACRRLRALTPGEQEPGDVSGSISRYHPSAPSPAAAPGFRQWRLVSSGKDSRGRIASNAYFALMPGQSGSIRRSRFMLSFSTNQSFGAYGSFLSNEGIQEFDCRSHLLRFVSNVLHLGPNGTGRVVFSIPSESRWHPVAKDGLQPKEEHFTCQASG